MRNLRIWRHRERLSVGNAYSVQRQEKGLAATACSCVCSVTLFSFIFHPVAIGTGSMVNGNMAGKQGNKRIIVEKPTTKNRGKGREQRNRELPVSFLFGRTKQPPSTLPSLPCSVEPCYRLSSPFLSLPLLASQATRRSDKRSQEGDKRRKGECVKCQTCFCVLGLRLARVPGVRDDGRCLKERSYL